MEHKRATKNGDISNHISEYHRQTKHKIEWDSAECITYSTNYQQRLTLVSWYTNSEKDLRTDVQSYLHLTNESHMTSNETDQQTIDGSETPKQQPTNHHNFYISSTNLITTKLTNQNQDRRHKYHHLTTTLHLTLKMTTAQVVETSVNNNSLSKGYPHLEARQTND